MVAEFALVPVRPLAQACRRFGGVDDALRLGEQCLRGFAVEVDTLQVQAIVVFADGTVKRACHARPGHVALHLRPMFRLRLGDAVLGQVGEGLGVEGLDLGDVPGQRGVRKADHGAVQATGEMAAAELILLAGVWVNGHDAHAGDGFEQSDKDGFLALSASEQAQHAPVERGAPGPAEAVPERPLAGLADLTGA